MATKSASFAHARRRIASRGIGRPVFGIAVFLVSGIAAWALTARYVLLNFHEVVPGQVYRSAQPSTERLAEWIDRHDLRTVVNLRSEDAPGLAAERRVVESRGAELVVIRMSARETPSALSVRRLVETLETAPRPVLLHCLDGADRTGFASAIAAMAVGGRDLAGARDELSLATLHAGFLRDALPGVLDRAAEELGSRAEWKAVREWLLHDYHTVYYRARLEHPVELRVGPGARVVLPVRLANRADEPIPADDPARHFQVAAVLGSTAKQLPDAILGSADLPRRRLAPGESVGIDVEVRAPDRPGVYRVTVDAVEHEVTWFAAQGSEPGRLDLVVTP